MADAGTGLDPRELMALHVHALFVHDARDRIVRVNEPNGRPAPRFFLGRTAAGHVSRYRHDVPDAVIERMEALCRREPIDRTPSALPRAAQRYESLLAAIAPVTSVWSGPAFVLPSADAPRRAIAIDSSNHRLLSGGFDDWLADVPMRRPFMAVVETGRAVSVCASVRITARAHEAGVETLPEHRRRGYAVDVVADWASAVRDLEALPLYSTSWQNVASQRVAARLGARMLGVDFHVT